ncbi:MAG: tandem-95 repeat protein [Thermoplasmatota archaeon]
MGKRRGVLVSLLMAAAVLSPLSLADGGGRTPDSDNDFDFATAVSDGVPASGNVNSADDVYDYFKITGVSSGQTVRAVLTWTNPSASLNLSIYNPLRLRLSVISSGTRANTILAAINGTYYFQIKAHSGTTDYTLNVTLATPSTLVPGTPISGSAAAGSQDRGFFYRFWMEGNVSGRSQAAIVNLTQSNSGARLQLYLMDIANCFSIQNYNESWNTQNRRRVAAAASYTGWYYVNVMTDQGSTDYTLELSLFDVSSDGNNDPMSAAPAPRNARISGSVNKAWDHYDWYAYTMKANDNIIINVTRYGNDQFNVSVYSSDMTFLTSRINEAYYYGYPYTTSWVNFTTPSALKDEVFYIFVSCTREYTSGAGGGYTDNEGILSYWLNISSPNHPPVITAPFENVVVDEDESYILYPLNHFKELDGDPLSFTVTSTGGNIQGEYSAQTGALSVHGAPNWYGRETAYVNAIDSWGMKTSQIVNVTVNSVEDPPAVNEPIKDVSMLQGGRDTSIDLSRVFFDNDTRWGDTLTYAVENNGSLWVDIGPSGRVTLTCPPTFYGSISMTFVATDRTGFSASAPCRVTVSHVNQPPQVKNQPPPVVVNEDEATEVDMSRVFSDPEGEPLSLAFSGASRVRAEVRAGGLNVTFAPLPDLSDFTEEVTVTATDPEGLSASVAVAVTVVPVNDPPRVTAFSPPGNVTISEGESQEYCVTASDPEKGPVINLTWYLDEQLVHMGTSVFLYKTNYTSAGSHVVVVAVDDGELTTRLSWNITVRNVNREPTDVRILSPKPQQVIKQGEAVTFQGFATDPDGDPLTFQWMEGIKELGTGQNFTTSSLSPGSHTIFLQVSDETAVVKSPSLTITIRPNTMPRVISFSPQDGQRFQKGKRVEFRVEAVDDEGDDLTYTWYDGSEIISNLSFFIKSDLRVGKHTLRLLVSDGLIAAELTATIEVFEPPAEGPNMTLVTIGAAVAIMVAIVAGFWAWKMRKPGDEN